MDPELMDPELMDPESSSVKKIPCLPWTRDANLGDLTFARVPGFADR